MSDVPKEPVNKLVLNWMQEWKNDCGRVGSKMEFVFLRAIKSLRDHKEPVYSAEELRKLKFFGDKICERIRKALRELNKDDNDDIPLSQASQASHASVTSMGTIASDMTDFTDEFPIQGSQDSRPAVSPKKKRAPRKQTDRKYIPRYRSGGFAVLVALYKAEVEEDMDTLNKNDLVQRAQKYADESMTSGSGAGYTSWSSMSTLVRHDYVVIQKGRFPHYSLTDAGRDIASKLVSTMGEQESVPVPIVSNGVSTTLESGKFDVFLLIDSREQYTAGSSDTRKTGLLNEFTERDIRCKMVKLPVGDFAWMAREKSFTSSDLNHAIRKEFLLDYVIERKRSDDLASSLRDHRWMEQKYRLLHSGVRHPMYLIEDFGSHRKQEGMFNQMFQSIMDTVIVDECVVKQTKTYSETIEFLTLMTRFLESMYLNRTLYSCTKEEILSGSVSKDHFMTMNEFNLCADKITNFTVKEMFIKHLLKFKGISVPKAKAISDIYPTVTHLLEAYETCETLKEKELLLSEIIYSTSNRKIGPVLSRKVHRFYSAKFTS
ncbi:mus81 structure-specific endonuclease subunit [Brevipalpus obovatus]|uniref:mus81 structure-specific endonuclease subunit n=1 Tax=Brevipalpus obovatus TaxID=246614 RepID=UPI003D9F6C54